MSNFHSQDPDDSAFTSHNHGTFDIQMSRGSLNAPFTFPLNDISIGSVSPDNLDDAPKYYYRHRPSVNEYCIPNQGILMAKVYAAEKSKYGDLTGQIIIWPVEVNPDIDSSYMKQNLPAEYLNVMEQYLMV